MIIKIAELIFDGNEKSQKIQINGVSQTKFSWPNKFRKAVCLDFDLEKANAPNLPVLFLKRMRIIAEIVSKIAQTAAHD